MEEGCCFVCLECPSSFASLRELEEHSKARHNAPQQTMLKTEELDAEMEDDASSTHSPSPTASEHAGSAAEDSTRHFVNKNQCRFCAQVFDDQSQLGLHITTSHADRKTYSCSECNAVFAVKRELATHFRIHQGTTPYACAECGKEFGTRQLLKKHCMWHSGERSHVCPHCNKAFFQKGHLTQHLMIHAGGRPHVCQLCQKTFIFKFDLNRHMKIHTERSHSCVLCGKTFSRSKQLADHLAAKCQPLSPNSTPALSMQQQHQQNQQPPQHAHLKPLLSMPMNIALPQPQLLSPEELSRVAQLIRPQISLPTPPLAACLVCGHSFASQTALLLHMALHFGPSLLQQSQLVLSPAPLIQTSSSSSTIDNDDSTTSSSCPSSPLKTALSSGASSPAMHVKTDDCGDETSCNECERQRARTALLEEQMAKQRDAIKLALEKVTSLSSQLGVCSPFDPTFALQTHRVFQQIHSALHNVECQ